MTDSHATRIPARRSQPTRATVRDINDLASAPAKAITVTGAARGQTTGGLAARAVVNAYWRTPHGETLVGSSVSDVDGQYRLRIAAAAVNGARPDLVVRVIGDAGEIIGESDPVAAPRRRAKVDVQIALAGVDALPEAGRLAEKLRERLPASLEAKEIKPLAAEIGETAERVRTFARAARLSGSLGVPVDVIYALLRQGHPSDVEKLSSVTAAALHKSLKSAVKERIIDAPADTAVSAQAGRLCSACWAMRPRPSHVQSGRCCASMGWRRSRTSATLAGLASWWLPRRVPWPTSSSGSTPTRG
jgi:hypothetical protein